MWLVSIFEFTNHIRLLLSRSVSGCASGCTQWIISSLFTFNNKQVMHCVLCVACYHNGSGMRARILQWIHGSHWDRIMDLPVRILLLLVVALCQSTTQLTFRDKFAESRRLTVNYDTPPQSTRYKYEIKTFNVRVSYAMLHYYTHTHI